MNFKLNSKFFPSGDQPNAIDKLTAGLTAGLKYQTLLGGTGTGKTFTIANVIQNVQKPTLILAHNKTLAAQLFSEFRDFFPNNAVHYFISYYDYYQPEAYVPQRDLYIEKEVDINKDIEKYRASSTQALLTRNDVIIVASVSCIYGLGDPEDYMALTRTYKVGEKYKRDNILSQLFDLQYNRADMDFMSGTFRIVGDRLEIYAIGNDDIYRLDFFGEELEKISVIQYISGKVIENVEEVKIFPAKQYITPQDKINRAYEKIERELKDRIEYYDSKGQLLESKRIDQRVKYDLEMMRETGYVSGIENYSRIIEGREPGSAPSTLLSYYPSDFLLVVDESHITLPQVRGMYEGDKARKNNLVDYGFRLPCALDNRPLKFEEFNSKINQVIFVSATPQNYEIDLSKSMKRIEEKTISYEIKEKLTNYNGVVEQIIRPTGLVDPMIYIHKIEGQMEDLQKEILDVINRGERIMITTLTKRMAEDLTTYLKELNLKVTYIHSDIDSIERVEILRDLRLGHYDILVGINLLREGLDLPEVSLVAILDADKEGFLRSTTSLIQTIGRAARNVNGKVIMYADKITDSMTNAINETNRRRSIQQEYNKLHNITPQTIIKEIKMEATLVREDESEYDTNKSEYNDMLKKADSYKIMSKKEQKSFLKELKYLMELKADMMEFEDAAKIRDLINSLK